VKGNWQFLHQLATILGPGLSISQQFYLQDGGKNQPAEQNYITVSVCIANI